VTGGTGSIGRRIVSKLLQHAVRVVRVLSNDENSLFRMQMELNDDRLRYFLGDVRDERRMRLAAREADVILHAAALKHVPIGEYNPFEVVQTNVIGTQNMISAALEENVERFLLISSDKAVNPTSTMGASKLLCEKLVVDASAYAGGRKTRFACIRFGNVLDSRGNVAEIFESQIERGGPVTVTDPHMTRFAFLSADAVSSVMKALTGMMGGEIFVPEMQALNVSDLAEVMIEKFSLTHGLEPSKIAIQVTKSRPGEKIHEELMTTEEGERAVECDGMYVILPATRDVRGYESNPRPKTREYSSASQPPMTRQQIARLLGGLVAMHPSF